MIRGRFRFDGATHRYFVGRRPVPAITTVLRESGRAPSGPWMREEHRTRGRLVHSACLTHDLGAEVVLDEQYYRWFEGWLRFVRDVRPRFTLLEQPQVDRQRGFAGTPDRVGIVRGIPETVIEIKTGQPAPWHGLQTAAQDLLLGGPLAGRRRRMVVYLPGDGTCRVREHTRALDYIDFLDALRDTHDAEADATWDHDDERGE